MTETTDVLIIGAGPAGLLLACELRLAAVATVVIERTPKRPDYCRGFNLNPRASTCWPDAASPPGSSTRAGSSRRPRSRACR